MIVKPTLFAKAGEKITADDGTVWGEFTQDIWIGEGCDSRMKSSQVIRADGTKPEFAGLFEKEVYQFVERRMRELNNATQEA